MCLRYFADTNILHKSERMQEVFREEPMVAYRRDSNLSDILVHSKLKRDMPGQRTACKAESRVCNIQAGHDSMCTERDVIYGLTCTECGKVVYVGETGRQLKERVKEHLRDVIQQGQTSGSAMQLKQTFNPQCASLSS